MFDSLVRVSMDADVLEPEWSNVSNKMGAEEKMTGTRRDGGLLD